MIRLTRTDRWVFYILLVVVCAVAVYKLVPTRGQRAAAELVARRGGLVDRIDLNRALAEDIELVRGIGKTGAERIVRARSQDGPFASYDDFFSRLPWARRWEEAIRRETRLGAEEP